MIQPAERLDENQFNQSSIDLRSLFDTREAAYRQLAEVDKNSQYSPEIGAALLACSEQDRQLGSFIEREYLTKEMAVWGRAFYMLKVEGSWLEVPEELDGTAVKIRRFSFGNGPYYKDQPRRERPLNLLTRQPIIYFKRLNQKHRQVGELYQANLHYMELEPRLT